MKKIILLALLFVLTAAENIFAHEGHMHTAGNLPAVAWGFQGTGSIYNIHPIFVHFPVALFPAALLFYAIGMFSKKDNVIAAGRWTLWLATIGAGLAVLTGDWAGDHIPHDEEVHQIMQLHETLGFIILGSGAILSVWAFILKRRPRAFPLLFLILFGGLNLILAQQADLGGRMVYLKGAGVKAAEHEASMLLEEAEEQHAEAVEHAGPM